MRTEEILIRNCTAEHLPQPYNLYAELIGVDKLYILAKELGGTTIYIPKTQYLLKEVMEVQLKKEFDGGNYKELAQKYNVCEKTIRNWLKKKKKLK
ncbi:MAG: DNA-binding protein [Epulopiscium sp.]|nr:DNA-binding protein [Candidatus Epulonipiscium sp.]